MNKLQQPGEVREYKGQECKLMNINWTKHLEQAWQCNYKINEWKTLVTYGATANDAFKIMKEKIDSYFLTS